MRRHASYFKLFFSVPAPTRDTRGSKKPLTEDTIDRAYLDHVKRMEKPGVYGDNLEIVAFARCYGVDVKIYQREFAYMVSGERDAGEVDEDEDGDGGSNSMLGKEEMQTGERKVLHIAYHDWEHYSSVRNLDGPHKGLPNVSPKPLTEEGRKKQQETLEQGVVIMPWMEDVVERSLPGVLSKNKIREALEKSKGNVNLAVSRLLDEAEDAGNAEGAEGERMEGAEEEPPGPNKEEQASELAKAGKNKQKKKVSPPKTEASPPRKQNPKTGNKPKRETARERKERQQKEKMDKKKAKAGGGATAGKESKESTSANTGTSNEGIKTLHV